MEKMLVRLKPYDPKRRHVMQSYTHAPSGLRFESARGWYRVNADIAAYLSTVPQVENDPDSPMAFDVVTDDQGKMLDEREERARELRASADNPNELDQTPPDLTTADLRAGGRRGVTEPQTRADAPTPGLRRDGAVEPGRPPHYAADDPKGYRRVVHREDLPDISSPVPGPPPVTGALPGGHRATAEEPHEPTPAPPPMPAYLPAASGGLVGGPNPAVSYGNYPPPGYGDPESLRRHIERTDETLKEESEKAEKASRRRSQRPAKDESER